MLRYLIAFLWGFSLSASAQVGSTASTCIWSGTFADCLPSDGILLRDQRGLYMRESTAFGTNAVKLKASSIMGADYTITFPASDGTIGQWVTTNGSGVLSFSDTTVSGKLIDGQADENQLRLQGHSTQTSDVFVVEKSDGTDLLQVTNVNGTLIRGTTTNDNAATGFVGEYLEATFSALSVPTSNQRGDLATLTLSAGDWDVSGTAVIARNSATYSVASYNLSIISASGNSATGEVDGRNLEQESAATSTTANSFSIRTPIVRVTSDGTNVTIAGTSTASQVVRLKYFPGTYSAATPQAYGILRARRIR